MSKRSSWRMPALILSLCLGITESAGQVLSDSELVAYLNDEVLTAYSRCNKLTIGVASEIGSVHAEVYGLSATDMDIAVEAAMDCNEEWLEVVKQFASTKGYAEALAMGNRVRDRLIEKNLATLKAPKQ